MLVLIYKNNLDHLLRLLDRIFYDLRMIGEIQLSAFFLVNGCCIMVGLFKVNVNRPINRDSFSIFASEINSTDMS